MATIIHTTPRSVTNGLMHAKLTDDVEKPFLPVTSYYNVMSKPEVVKDVGEKIGAPFHLLVTDTVECDEDYIINLCGHIL